jgi:hypothetical protein
MRNEYKILVTKFEGSHERRLEHDIGTCGNTYGGNVLD